jgi:hypothetical protein
MIIDVPTYLSPKGATMPAKKELKYFSRRQALKLLAAAGVTGFLAAGINACSRKDEERIILGSGEHRYQWIRNWAKLPTGMTFGNTHGCIAVDADNRILMNTDSEHAIIIFDADGNYQGSWGKDLAGGLHGMTRVTENGTDYLYLAHHKRRQSMKASMTGEILWSLGCPLESGIYETDEKFRPTSIVVLPDGSFWVADGYGKSYIHIYDKDRNYIRSIGGKGDGADRLNTPHGLWLDTRRATPAIIVADRENHRLKVFDLEGGQIKIVEGDLRRPCNMHQHGDDLAVADLAGRVTILDHDYNLITHLGDNPDPEKRAKNGIPKEAWVDGLFISPHGAAWDSRGDLYVMDWLALGRISKLQRIS